MVAATVVGVVDIPTALVGVLSVPSAPLTEKTVVVSETSTIATKEAILLRVLVCSANGESEGDGGKKRQGLHGDLNES